MAGMRNRMVHNYGSIDLEIVWDALETHIPRLLADLSALHAE
jgi:uncharacterized protein with HEPN domain